MKIGITGFACVCGCTFYAGRKLYRRRHPVVKPEEAIAVVPPNVSVNPESPIQEKEDDSAFLPWWTGVKEISLYINDSTTDDVNNRFPAKYSYV